MRSMTRAFNLNDRPYLRPTSCMCRVFKSGQLVIIVVYPVVFTSKSWNYFILDCMKM